MSALVPCPSCRRHARAGAACPFCGAWASGAAVPPMHRRPTSRRDVLLFATTIAAVGCGSTIEEPVPVADSATTADAADGAAIDSAMPDTETPIIDSAMPDDLGSVPLYGAAPFK